MHAKSFGKRMLAWSLLFFLTIGGYYGVGYNVCLAVYDASPDDVCYISEFRPSMDAGFHNAVDYMEGSESYVELIPVSFRASRQQNAKDLSFLPFSAIANDTIFPVDCLISPDKNCENHSNRSILNFLHNMDGMK